MWIALCEFCVIVLYVHLECVRSGLSRWVRLLPIVPHGAVMHADTLPHISHCNELSPASDSRIKILQRGSECCAPRSACNFTPAPREARTAWQVGAFIVTNNRGSCRFPHTPSFIGSLIVLGGWAPLNFLQVSRKFSQDKRRRFPKPISRPDSVHTSSNAAAVQSCPDCIFVQSNAIFCRIAQRFWARRLEPWAHLHRARAVNGSRPLSKSGWPTGRSTIVLFPSCNACNAEQNCVLCSCDAFNAKHVLCTVWRRSKEMPWQCYKHLCQTVQSMTWRGKYTST